MTPNDKQRFAVAIYALGEYYGKTLSKGVIDIYWQGLESYSIDALESAISRHLRNPDCGQFMPKIAEIVKMLEGSTKDSAVIAWAKVMRGISGAGMYQSVVFDDAMIHVAIEGIGGWIKLCQSSEQELPFVQRRFEEYYRAHKSRGELPDYPKRLVGIAEGENASKGYAIPPPKFIGNPDDASFVYALGKDSASVPVSLAHRALSVIESNVNKGAA